MIQLRPFEPVLPTDRDSKLADLAHELAVEAATFRAAIPPDLGRSLGTLVRAMNCYYSNLIEGHHTHPVDIQRALAGHYDHAPAKRNLQLEARAHIEVQELIERGEAPSPVMSEDFIRWTHQQFCNRLPAELLVAEEAQTGIQRLVSPGAYRQHHVTIGRHLAPAPDQIGLLMRQFVEAYSAEGCSRADQIVRVASAHHRLLWIHPFLDGNGRVARLFSHAALRECGVGSDLWSISRGLARHISDYKANLAAADEPRHGDLDGRGNLSNKALSEFCTYFLTTCLDQVRFMRQLVDPASLANRIGVWADENVANGNLPRGSRQLLQAVIRDCSLARGQVGAATGYQERQARNVLRALLARGYLVSETPKSAVRLAFPMDIAERWLPLLYPATTTS